MRLFFRYDDYSEISNAPIDLAVIQSLIDAGFVPLVGVIPMIADINWPLGGGIPLRRISLERVKPLKFLSPYVEIGLHGYTHQAVTRYSGLFEFGDIVDLDRQIERLNDGKQILEDYFGLNVNWFVPPWNAYSGKTLNALKLCGFDGISADAAFGSVSDDLCFAPASGLVHELNLFESFASLNDCGDVIVVLHDYDFQESGSPMARISIPDFRQQVSKLRKCNVAPGRWSSLIGDSTWGSRRAKANQALRKQSSGFFRLLTRPGFSSVYWQENFAIKKAAQLETQARFFRKVLGLYRRIFR